MGDGAFLERLRAHIGTRGDGQPARDAVNQAMVRHWCDAMQDANPNYTNADDAAKSVHGTVVAPPTMLNAWTMLGLVDRSDFTSANDPMAAVLRELDAAGYSSVVATNSEHEYERYLKLGDVISGTVEVTEISEEKQTALGIGHFMTTETEYHDQDGESVGRMRFRILKFRPGTGRIPLAEEGAEAAPPVRRPRPGISRDTKFFWDGMKEGELRIQECSGCEALHHPPMVRCPACGSFEFGHRVSSGRGELYSHVEVHYPQIPGLDYPLAVGVIELEEGTRLISNVVDIEAERIEVGMPLEVGFLDDGDLSIPVFRAARPPRRETTLRFNEVEVGQELGPCPIPITPTLIVSTAIASRDYQDVHHDPALAKKRGSPNIFMNILTSGGLCGRYVTDWAGPDALMRSIRIRLGAPNYPGDCMTMYGSVKSKEMRDGAGIVEVEVRGTNRLGNHAVGTIELELPVGSGA
jgi:uncharacterized OB-fold protein/acyl dehydratase